MAIIARVLDIAVVIATIIFVVFVVILMGAKVFGFNEYVVLSGSMEPSIMTGALVVVNTNDTAVGEGDIIAFTVDRDEADTTYDTDATTVTHRIVKVNADGSYTTKGDNNETEDAKHINPSQVIGKYVLNVPELGYVLSLLSGKGMLLVICWIIAMNIITSAFVKLAEG